LFAEHSRALRSENLDDLIATFHDDAIVIANKKVYRGREGIRQVFSRLLSEVPQAKWEVEPVWADDVLYIEWKARSSAGRIDDGIDSSPSATARSRCRRFTARCIAPEDRARSLGRRVGCGVCARLVTCLGDQPTI
jgi:SnoaL-like domain